MSYTIIKAQNIKLQIRGYTEREREREDEGRKEGGVCNRSIWFHSIVVGEALITKRLYCQSHCS